MSCLFVCADIRLLERTAITPDRIWHAATVYRDAVMANMDDDKWNSVVDTKLAGYNRLRHCFPTTPIVAISSVVAYFGNAGQSHYALANAALDAAARADPHTLSVRLGALDNVGFITTTNRTLFETVPFAIMRIDDVLDRLQEVSALYDSGVFAVYDWKTSTGPMTGRHLSTYTLLDAQSQLVTILGGTPIDTRPPPFFDVPDSIPCPQWRWYIT